MLLRFQPRPDEVPSARGGRRLPGQVLSGRDHQRPEPLLRGRAAVELGEVSF